MEMGKSEDTTNQVPGRWEDFARLCLIRSGSKVMNFNPYDYQIRLSKALDNNNYLLVAKTRQLGITEMISCKFLHWAALNRGFAGVILSKSQADASNIAKRVRRMILGRPEMIRLKTDNLTDIELENGGRLIFRPSTPNSTRGLESISAVLIDECAFIDKIEEIYTAVIPTLEMSDNPKVALVSTPNGASGFFWERLNSGNQQQDFLQVCHRVKTGEIEPYQEWIDENHWVKSIVHWRGHPVYSSRENYLENISHKKQLSLQAVRQEYDLDFSEGSATVFSPRLVESACRQTITAEGHGVYYMGVDPNFGGDDYCVAIVVGLSGDNKLEVVDSYRANHQLIVESLREIRKLANAYAVETIAVEVNSGGRIYAEQLTQTIGDIPIKEITMTENSKRLLIDRIILSLERDRLRFDSQSPLKEELLLFRRDGRKMGAPVGKHDDCVMALGLALSTVTLDFEDTPVWHWML